MLIYLRSRFLDLITTLTDSCKTNLVNLGSLLNQDAIILELAKDERKKILNQISALKKVESCSAALVTRFERVLETSIAPISENFNRGAEVLSQVRVSDFSNMYEQYADMKKTIMFLAQSNNAYKGNEYSPDPSKFEKVDSVPSLCAKLYDMLKSHHSPPVKSSLSLKLSHRPILGPYKDKTQGRIYISQFKNGAPDGLTFFLNKDGGFFYGEFKGGHPNGRGLRGYSSGSTYFGQLKNGVRNGLGVNRWSNGSVYDGEWRDHLTHGQGIYIWGDGEQYNGEFKDNKQDGIGSMLYKDSDSYYGEWSQGKIQGKGVYTW